MQITRQGIFTTFLGHRQLSLSQFSLSFFPLYISCPWHSRVFAKEKSGKCNTYPSHASRLVTETGFRSANNNNQIDERYNFHPFTAPHSFFRFHFDRFFFFNIQKGWQFNFFFGYIFHAGMNMAAITKAIPEMSLRTWLDDILINLLRMWEYNM